MRLIALSGRMKSGKDTVYDFIKAALPNQRVQRFAFADALKAEVAAVCGVPIADVDDRKSLYRALLQWWGTEWRRGQDTNYWINQLRDRLDVAKEANLCDLAIITDCRFRNEAEFAREYGGLVFRIVRDNQPEGEQHISETDLDDFQFDNVLLNNGTLEDLRSTVDFCIVGFLRRAALVERRLKLGGPGCHPSRPVNEVARV